MQRNGDGSFKPLHVPCDVLSQTEKTYRIRVLASSVNGHKWGDIMRVQKRMVTPEEEPVDNSNQWWNN